MKLHPFLLWTLLPLLLLVLIGCTRTTPGPTATPAGSGESGRAVFAITDAAMDLGTVTSIKVTISGIRVHAQGGAWLDVSFTEQTFDLLELKASGVSELMADVQLSAGNYDMMELSISKIVIVDAEGEHEAKLPSGKLQLKGELIVEAGATATAHFDFLADQSLHLTGEGRYIFAPVIQMETRSRATAQVQANKEVRISGGSPRTRAQLGMDAEGNVDAGIRIVPDAVLRIAADGRVMQTQGTALTTGAVKAVDMDNGIITITTRAGADLDLYLASDSEVHLSGSPARAADLSGRISAETVVRYDAETKVISKIVVAADYEAKATVSADLSIIGDIKTVDTARGTVTITTASGRDVTVQVASDARINLAEVTGLAGLEARAGENIRLGYDANSGQLKELRSEVSAEAEALVTGTVKAVNPADGTITITTAAGTETTLKTTANSRLMANGALATLASLRAMVGTEVSVEYQQETMFIRNLHARGKAQGFVEATGTVKAVNTADGTVTLALEGGQELTLKATANSSLLADGVISSLRGISAKVGGEVSVLYDSSTMTVISMKARVQTNARVAGTLKEVDLRTRTLTVVSASGEVTLTVDTGTDLSAGGQAVTLAELATMIGAEVTAEFNAQSMAATAVKAQGKAVVTGKASGVIKTVDSALRRVTLTLDAGGDLTLTLAEGVTIYAGGAVLSASDLSAKVGSRVVVEFAAGTRTVISILIVGDAAARGAAEGVIQAVDVLAGVIVVSTSRGEVIKLRMNANTRILVGGRAAALAALAANVGSRVAVQYDAQTSTALAIEITGVAMPTSALYSGTLKTVDTAAGTVTITTGAGKDVVLKVDSQTRLLLDGSGTSLAALAQEIGASVNVDHNLNKNTATLINAVAGSRAPSSASAQSDASASTRASLSVVRAVNLVGGTITVITDANVELTLKVTAESKVLIGGGAGTLAQLLAHIGGQVKVEYNVETMTVVSLSV
ncbi:MAG: DUF4382 domain-containing protein [Chloroflexi bacterium]|nr:DUF4382 domain-containing protein [Chloroflexota bacterium]